ncbi:MAG: hypothetical protein COB53_02890 [Elusimicrobia bacterium]|nr:MAG: hypothetical protein COB53_02890 [Elusimicrobiota bacterium]
MGIPAVLIQFLKYAIAGVIGTVIHIGLFHALAWKLFPALQASDWAVKALGIEIVPIDDATRSRNSMIANFGGFMVTNFIVYVINVIWVFEAGKYSWWIELLLFYAVSSISMVIGTTTMGFLIRRFGMLTSYAFCANLVSALLINFAARKYFIFNG